MQLSRERDRRLAAVGLDDAVTRTHQVAPKEAADLRLVINDQDPAQKLVARDAGIFRLTCFHDVPAPAVHGARTGDPVGSRIKRAAACGGALSPKKKRRSRPDLSF